MPRTEPLSNVDFFCKEHAPKSIGYQGELEKLVGMYVKKGFPVLRVPNVQREHMWVKVKQVVDGVLVGTLASDPLFIPTLQFGRQVVVRRDEIEGILE